MMAEKNREYVDAARALGRSDAAILLPGDLAKHGQLDTRTRHASNGQHDRHGVILELPPAWASRREYLRGGSMIADGRRYMLGAWWVATLPGIALALLVLGMNLLGEGLRDVLDPKMMEG